MPNKTITIPFPIQTDTTNSIIQDFINLNRQQLTSSLTLVEIGRTTGYGRQIASIDGPTNAVLTIVEEDGTKYRHFYFQIQENKNA